jgi:hypothetical protein
MAVDASFSAMARSWITQARAVVPRARTGRGRGRTIERPQTEPVDGRAPVSVRSFPELRATKVPHVSKGRDRTHQSLARPKSP